MQALQSNSNEIIIPKAFKELFEPKRYKIYYGGRGGAKSHNIARALLIMGMQKPMRIVCAREIQKSIDDSVHALLSDLIKTYELGWFYEVQKKTIIGRNGTEIKYRGLKHNTTDLKSLEGADICWIEEAENVSNNSYEIVIPTIRKDGSEIWVSFNPKNPTDPTWTRFVQTQSDRMLVKKVSWRDNPFFPQVLEDERQELEKTDPEAYKHVWEGEFDTRYSGAVYAKWVAKLNELGRVSSKVTHDPNYPVYTAWDLGYDDATSIIFFQLGSNEVFIIDYYESNMEDVKHYCEVLYGRRINIHERDMATGEVQRWEFGDELPHHAHRKDYAYHAHYVPHDADYKIQAAGGRSIVSQAARLGVKMFTIPATSQQNSIEALRETLPKCWINADRCRDLVTALMHYHFEYDEDRKIFKSAPNHDWSSHAADAGELLGRMWKEKATTMKTLESQAVHNTFHRLRRENNLVQEDPYRVRSK